MTPKRCTAIVLAAGSGSRMKSNVAKQFLPLNGKPLIWYALQVMEQSEIIDSVILVTGEADLDYTRREIVEKYGFRKVEAVIPGGSERYFSVAEALRVITGENGQMSRSDGYVFIHDGARPFLTHEILCRTYEAVRKYNACVAAVPVKDTIKIADREGFAASTPSRNLLWSVQTPQVFDTGLIANAYARLMEEEQILREQGIQVTDDASVLELFTDTKVKLVEASYENIKITTPEDIAIAESLLNSGENREM